MILPALTEATSPFWRPIQYSLFPPRSCHPRRVSGRRRREGPRRTSAGTSSRSGSFRSGRITSERPAACAASTFCFTPPIGSTRPCSVTSPVMPMVDFTGRPDRSEAMAVTMVIPALGPSVGVAPAGT